MIKCPEFFSFFYSSQTIVYSLLLSLLSYILYRFIKLVYINKYYKRNVLKVLLQRKQEIDLFLLKYSDSVPKSLQAQILELSACEIISRIKSSRITSEQVLITYALRSATIGLDYNLIADINFEEAINDARSKDQKLLTLTPNEPSLPLLYGLPISVKDHITTKGFRYTAGYMKTALWGKSPDDCNFIKVLRENGAIPYVSSNLPQGIGSIESNNGFWGRAINPWDRKRTPGGSSGGEAGLIASKCSVLGIGSDAAGSIRIPCSFCGIYGFAPTGKRVSLKRTRNIRIHDFNVYREINCTYGPMGRSVDDLILIMKCLYGKFTGLDPDVPPLQWDEKKYKESSGKKLRIGVIYDNFCESFPAIRSVVEEVVAKMKEKGHEIIKIEENWTEEFLLIGMPVMQAHGMATNIEKTLAGEIPESSYRLQVLLSYLPKYLMKFFGYMSRFVGEERFGKLLGILYDRDLEEYYQEVIKKELLKDKFADFWLKNKFDCLITPVLPYPAIKHGDAGILQGLIASTFIYNIMGMPSGVVPIRKIKDSEEYYNTRFNDMAARKLRSTLKGIKGLPVGVQVASWNYDDETCLALMKQIEEEFKFHQYPKI